MLITVGVHGFASAEKATTDCALLALTSLGVVNTGLQVGPFKAVQAARGR